MLVENSEPSIWSFIWSLIQQDYSFGREVLELVACRYSHGIQLNLTETQLADLYVWLVRQYPYDEDLDRSNEVLAHFVTARDGIANLRDSVLSQLRERGTLQPCAEIQRLARELLDITWLGKTLIDAQANMRRKTWQPSQPAQIFQLLGSKKNAQSTHIQTGVLIMQEANNPNLNFGGSVGAVNVNSTVHGNQIGTQYNYASDRNLAEAFDEIQQIFNRLTQNYPISTESEQQIVVAEVVKEVKQNPTLMKRVKIGGQAFIFEALQKASDQWWVSPFVKAIEAGIKGE